MTKIQGMSLWMNCESSMVLPSVPRVENKVVTYAPKCVRSEEEMMEKTHYDHVQQCKET